MTMATTRVPYVIDIEASFEKFKQQMKSGKAFNKGDIEAFQSFLTKVIKNINAEAREMGESLKRNMDIDTTHLEKTLQLMSGIFEEMNKSKNPMSDWAKEGKSIYQSFENMQRSVAVLAQNIGTLQTGLNQLTSSFESFKNTYQSFNPSQFANVANGAEQASNAVRKVAKAFVTLGADKTAIKNVKSLQAELAKASKTTKLQLEIDYAALDDATLEEALRKKYGRSGAKISLDDLLAFDFNTQLDALDEIQRGINKVRGNEKQYAVERAKLVPVLNTILALEDKIQQKSKGKMSFLPDLEDFGYNDYANVADIKEEIRDIVATLNEEIKKTKQTLGEATDKLLSGLGTVDIKLALSGKDQEAFENEINEYISKLNQSDTIKKVDVLVNIKEPDKKSKAGAPRTKSLEDIANTTKEFEEEIELRTKKLGELEAELDKINNAPKKDANDKRLKGRVNTLNADIERTKKSIGALQYLLAHMSEYDAGEYISTGWKKFTTQRQLMANEQNKMLDDTRKWRNEMNDLLNFRYTWNVEGTETEFARLEEELYNLSTEHPIQLVPDVDFLVDYLESALAEREIKINVVPNGPLKLNGTIGNWKPASANHFSKNDVKPLTESSKSTPADVSISAPSAPSQMPSSTHIDSKTASIIEFVEDQIATYKVLNQLYDEMLADAGISDSEVASYVQAIRKKNTTQQDDGKQQAPTIPASIASKYGNADIFANKLKQTKEQLGFLNKLPFFSMTEDIVALTKAIGENPDNEQKIQEASQQIQELLVQSVLEAFKKYFQDSAQQTQRLDSNIRIATKTRADALAVYNSDTEKQKRLERLSKKQAEIDTLANNPVIANYAQLLEDIEQAKKTNNRDALTALLKQQQEALLSVKEGYAQLLKLKQEYAELAKDDPDHPSFILAQEQTQKITKTEQAKATLQRRRQAYEAIGIPLTELEQLLTAGKNDEAYKLVAEQIVNRPGIVPAMGKTVKSTESNIEQITLFSTTAQQIITSAIEMAQKGLGIVQKTNEELGRRNWAEDALEDVIQLSKQQNILRTFLGSVVPSEDDFSALQDLFSYELGQIEHKQSTQTIRTDRDKAYVNFARAIDEFSVAAGLFRDIYQSFSAEEQDAFAQTEDKDKKNWFMQRSADAKEGERQYKIFARYALAKEEFDKSITYAKENPQTGERGRYGIYKEISKQLGKYVFRVTLADDKGVQSQIGFNTRNLNKKGLPVDKNFVTTSKNAYEFLTQNLPQDFSQIEKLEFYGGPSNEQYDKPDYIVRPEVSRQAANNEPKQNVLKAKQLIQLSQRVDDNTGKTATAQEEFDAATILLQTATEQLEAANNRVAQITGGTDSQEYLKQLESQMAAVAPSQSSATRDTIGLNLFAKELGDWAQRTYEAEQEVAFARRIVENPANKELWKRVKTIPVDIERLVEIPQKQSEIQNTLPHSQEEVELAQKQLDELAQEKRVLQQSLNEWVATLEAQRAQTIKEADQFSQSIAPPQAKTYQQELGKLFDEAAILSQQLEDNPNNQEAQQQLSGIIQTIKTYAELYKRLLKNYDLVTTGFLGNSTTQKAQIAREIYDNPDKQELWGHFKNVPQAVRDRYELLRKDFELFNKPNKTKEDEQEQEQIRKDYQKASAAVLKWVQTQEAKTGSGTLQGLGDGSKKFQQATDLLNKWSNSDAFAQSTTGAEFDALQAQYRGSKTELNALDRQIQANRELASTAKERVELAKQRLAIEEELAKTDITAARREELETNLEANKQRAIALGMKTRQFSAVSIDPQELQQAYTEVLDDFTRQIQESNAKIKKLQQEQTAGQLRVDRLSAPRKNNTWYHTQQTAIKSAVVVKAERLEIDDPQAYAMLLEEVEEQYPLDNYQDYQNPYEHQQRAIQFAMRGKTQEYVRTHMTDLDEQEAVTNAIIARQEQNAEIKKSIEAEKAHREKLIELRARYQQDMSQIVQSAPDTSATSGAPSVSEQPTQDARTIDGHYIDASAYNVDTTNLAKETTLDAIRGMLGNLGTPLGTAQLATEETLRAIHHLLGGDGDFSAPTTEQPQDVGHSSNKNSKDPAMSIGKAITIISKALGDSKATTPAGQARAYAKKVHSDQEAIEAAKLLYSTPDDAFTSKFGLETKQQLTTFRDAWANAQASVQPIVDEAYKNAVDVIRKAIGSSKADTDKGRAKIYDKKVHSNEEVVEAAKFLKANESLLSGKDVKLWQKLLEFRESYYKVNQQPPSAKPVPQNDDANYTSPQFVADLMRAQLVDKGITGVNEQLIDEMADRFVADMQEDGVTSNEYKSYIENAIQEYLQSFAEIIQHAAMAMQGGTQDAPQNEVAPHNEDVQPPHTEIPPSDNAPKSHSASTQPSNGGIIGVMRTELAQESTLKEVLKSLGQIAKKNAMSGKPNSAQDLLEQFRRMLESDAWEGKERVAYMDLATGTMSNAITGGQNDITPDRLKILREAYVNRMDMNAKVHTHADEDDPYFSNVDLKQLAIDFGEGIKQQILLSKNNMTVLDMTDVEDVNGLVDALTQTEHNFETLATTAGKFGAKYVHSAFNELTPQGLVKMLGIKGIESKYTETETRDSAIKGVLAEEAKEAAKVIQESTGRAIKTTRERIGPEWLTTTEKTDTKGNKTWSKQFDDSYTKAALATKKEFDALKLGDVFGKDTDAAKALAEYTTQFTKFQELLIQFKQNPNQDGLQAQFNELLPKLDEAEKTLNKLIVNKDKFLGGKEAVSTFTADQLKDVGTSLKSLAVTQYATDKGDGASGLGIGNNIAFNGLAETPNGTRLLVDVLENGIITRYALEVDRATGKVKEFTVAETALVNAFQNVNQAMKQHELVQANVVPTENERAMQEFLNTAHSPAWDEYLKTLNDMQTYTSTLWGVIKEGGSASSEELDYLMSLSERVKTLGKSVQTTAVNFKNLVAQNPTRVTDLSIGTRNNDGSIIANRDTIVRNQMDNLAKNQAMANRQQYEFVSFDNDKLKYTLTDAYGNVQKLTMEWHELYQKVVTTNDATVATLNPVVAKIAEYKQTIADAKNDGYLLDGVDKEFIAAEQAVQGLVEQVQNGKASFEALTEAREKVANLGKQLVQQITATKKLYTGITEVVAANKQHENLIGIFGADKLNNTDVQVIQSYSTAYEQLLKSYEQFANAKTLHNEQNQITLRQQAASTQYLGGQVKTFLSQNARKQTAENDAAIRQQMEEFARQNANTAKSQYSFGSFDGSTLQYTLTDLEGHIRKITLEWDELSKQVVMTSDKSVSALDPVVTQVQQYASVIQQATTDGYLAITDANVNRFTEVQQQIQNIAQDIRTSNKTYAEQQETLDHLRQSAIQYGKTISEIIAQNKALYTGISAMKSADQQYEKIIGVFGMGNFETSAVQAVTKYQEAYKALHTQYDQFVTEKTLADQNNQEQLRREAALVQHLGRELQNLIVQSNKLRDADQVFDFQMKFSETSGTRSQQMRTQMESFAQQNAQDRWSQYKFVSFEDDTLRYTLTDMEGHIQKVVLQWNELYQQLAITSDKSVSALDPVIVKIEEYNKKLQQAIENGYLAKQSPTQDAGASVDKNTQAQTPDIATQFENKVTEISTLIEEIKQGKKTFAENKEELDKLRESAAQYGEELSKVIARNEKLYQGTTELNAARRQHDSITSVFTIPAEQSSVKAVQEYQTAYQTLQETYTAFTTQKTLYDASNQEKLRQEAAKAQRLGKQLLALIAKGEQIKAIGQAFDLDISPQSTQATDTNKTDTDVETSTQTTSHREQVRQTLEEYAQKEALKAAMQYKFASFDDDTLQYTLTDIEGHIQKVTLQWSELYKQAAISAEKSTSALDPVVAKIQQYDEAIQQAVKDGYLAQDNASVAKFNELRNAIDQTIQGVKNDIVLYAEQKDELDKLRQSAVNYGAGIKKVIAQNKKLYTGTSEVRSVERQHDKLIGSFGAEQWEASDAQIIKAYTKAYDDLQAKYKQFAEERTLYDTAHQEQLRQEAVGVQKLGRQLMASITQADKLHQLVEQSSGYTDKRGQYHELGGISGPLSATEASPQNLEATMREYAKSVFGVNLENVKFNNTTQQLTGTLRLSNKTVADVAVQYNKAEGALFAYNQQERESLTGLPAFVQGFKAKITSILQYLASITSIYQIWGRFKQGVQYVREIDSALTELKKVTDETTESYERFLDTAAKTADKVGSTIKDIVSSTADWAKLGYSMEDAAHLAESTSVLLNVSEFDSIDSATSALISTMQAFGYTANESMHVVDVMNIIGNNFAVSTDGLAIALQDSASALMTANNSYQEAAAMVAAANKVVQKPSEVGAALRTISLRLRGTSVSELEEMGEDTTGAVETKSKLRSKLKGLTGVDILTNTGAYKSTYEILLEISKVWDDLTDENRAGALELIAGKTRSNVASALLTNTKDLEAAYQTALAAEGSALKENEKYLDSIQGKIDKLTNAWQTMWNNAIDDRVIRQFVTIGTALVKFVDKLGVLQTLVIGLGTYFVNKLDLSAIFDSGTQSLEKMKQTLESLKQKEDQARVAYFTSPNDKTQAKFESAQKHRSNYETLYGEQLQSIEDYNKALDEQLGLELERDILVGRQKTAQENFKPFAGLDISGDYNELLALQKTAQEKVSKTTSEFIRVTREDLDQSAVESYANALTEAQVELDDITQQVEATGAKADLDKINEQLEVNNQELEAARAKVTELGEAAGITGQQGASGFKKFGQGVQTVGKALGKIAVQMLAMYAVTVAFELLGKVLGAIDTAIDNAHESAEEAQDKFNQLNSELQSCTSELQSLESELETIQDQIAELSSGSISVIDQEEINRLKVQSAELEHQIAMQKALQQITQQQTNAASINATQKYLSDTSFDSEKTKSERQEEAKEDGEAWGQAAGGVLVGGITAAFLTGGTAAGAKIGAALGTIAGPLGTLVGVLAGAGIGALIGGLVGGAIGEGNEGAAYSQEQSVKDAIANITTERAALQENINKAFDERNAEAYQQATEELQKYDAMMAQHMSQIQANINAIDYETATKEQKEMIDAWNLLLDKYAITMGASGAQENAINRLLSLDQFKDTSDDIDVVQKQLENKQISAADANTQIQTLIGTNSALQDILVNEFQISVEQAAKYLVQFGEAAAETKEKLSSVLTPLANVETAFKSLGDAFDTFEENGIITAGTLAELEEQFGKLDGFEDFIAVLGDSSSTTEEVRIAISDLASEYLTTNGILDDLTEKNKAFVVAQLKALGVTNADEYLGDIESIHQAMADQYGVDLSNYGTVQSMKQAIAGGLHTYITEVQNSTRDELAKNYDEDFANFAETEKNKTKVALRAAEIRASRERDGAIGAATTEAEAIRNGTVLQKNTVEGWLGIDAMGTGKTYAEIKQMYDDGKYGNLGGVKTKIKAWLDSVEATYQNSIDAATIAAETAYTETTKQFADAAAKLNSLEEYINTFNPTLSFDADNLGGGDNASTTKKNKFDDLVKKYENQLALLSNQRDLIEAEIDKAEATGGKASDTYYKNLIANSTQERTLLEEKKEALEAYLNTYGSSLDQDTWTEMNNELNETAVAIKECTTNLLEYYDALDEIDAHYFNQAMEEASRLGEEIEFVQGLLEDEDVADENGNWTEAGITKLGLYVSEMSRAAQSAEQYKKEISNVAGSWADYQELLEEAGGDVSKISSEDLDALYEKYGVVITSKEEFTEKTNELTDAERKEVEAQNAAREGIIETNKARIEAIRNGIEKEIEAYEDYIDVLKDSLDAERDLYDFKRNVEKQTKDISTLERRIASLSGSTNAADIAERKRLEAELYESKQSLNDTYYDHAKDAQSTALDEEATAFRDSKEKYIEELEATLDDVEGLIENSMMEVLLNADVVYSSLTDIADTYGITLTSELTQPWKDASAQAEEWKKNIGEYTEGCKPFIVGLSDEIKKKLGEHGAWAEAETAAKSYADFINGNDLKIDSGISKLCTSIQGIVDKWGKVKEAADKAYQAQEAASKVGGKSDSGNTNNKDNGGDNDDGGTDKTPTSYYCNITLDATDNLGPSAYIGATATATTAKKAQTEAQQSVRNQVIALAKKKGMIDNEATSHWNNVWRHALEVDITPRYAKGTMGTSKDEWAITDEPWLGDELTMYATPEGRLSYMRVGSTVVPADATKEILKLADIGVNGLMAPKLNSGITLMSNAINKPEINLSFEALVKAERIDKDTLPEVKKFVQQEINSLVKQMNYALKGVGGR